MVSLTMKITKDIYEKSKYCGLMVNGEVQSDCAIQTCIKQIFPNSLVEYDFIHVYLENDEEPVLIDLPDVARDFIKVFDKSSPGERASMNELEFAIEIPDELLDRIDLSEIKAMLTANVSMRFA